MRKYYYRYAYGVRLMKMLMHAFRSLIKRRLHDVLGTAGSCFLCVEGIVPVHPATFELKAGFHPMEGENNMEWHGPNGPTYDNMMYDGNNQWNGYMHHGNNNYDEWMMDHYGSALLQCSQAFLFW